MAPKTAVLSVNASWNVVNFRLGVIRALQEEGFRVAVIAPPDAFSDRFAPLGIDYHPIPMDTKGVSPVRDLQLLVRYRRLLKRLRPQIFLGYTAKPNVYGSLAAHALGIPVINNVSGLGTAFIRENLLTRIVSSLYRIAFRRSATVFFQNRDDEALFVEKKLVRADQARRLPGSGINLAHYRPQPPEPAPERFSFLLLSRLLWDKGVGEFVEAARRVKAMHPEAEFRLLGAVGAANRTAVRQEQVRAWVEEGVVAYAGATDDVRPFIAAAGCVVLPSYREGLPRALLEGAAMAKPLIATDVPGCRDVVQDSINGFLCEARNAESLAQAMRRMLALSPTERASMGTAGRSMAEQRFDERLIQQSYVEAVRQAISRTR